MDSIIANPLLGVALHAVGATFAAACYTPEKRVKGWSWQTYWLTQASFCWFLLPILGADVATFDAYERAVREEYAFVDDAAFAKGRARVLRSFLDRDAIYGTTGGRALWEAAARANLERSLRALG